MFACVRSRIAALSDRRGCSPRLILRRAVPIISSTLLISTVGWHAEATAWQLTATWVQNTADVISGISLERATGPSGTYAQVATTAPGTSTYTDSGVTAGTTYCYRTRAFNSAGYSAYSNVACAAPLVTAVTVYRQSTGQWFALLPTGQTIQPTWGCRPCGDVPVPADYDGDGTADVAVFRPSTGTWYIVRSSDGALQQVQWGASGDVPVTGDFDGDGKTDVATYRPSTGIWYILRSSDGKLHQVTWGAVGDQPLALRHR